MPLCEHTVMRCGSQVYRCRQGEPGWLSLQFRVAGLSWPLELLGRIGPSHRGPLVVRLERDGRDGKSRSVGRGTDVRSKRRTHSLRCGGESVVMRRHARRPDGSSSVSKGGG